MAEASTDGEGFFDKDGRLSRRNLLLGGGRIIVGGTGIGWVIYKGLEILSSPGAQRFFQAFAASQKDTPLPRISDRIDSRVLVHDQYGPGNELVIQKPHTTSRFFLSDALPEGTRARITRDIPGLEKRIQLFFGEDLSKFYRVAFLPTHQDIHVAAETSQSTSGSSTDIACYRRRSISFPQDCDGLIHYGGDYQHELGHLAMMVKRPDGSFFDPFPLVVSESIAIYFSRLEFIQSGSGTREELNKTMRETLSPNPSDQSTVNLQLDKDTAAFVTGSFVLDYINQQAERAHVPNFVSQWIQASSQRAKGLDRSLGYEELVDVAGSLWEGSRSLFDQFPVLQ